MKWLLILQVLCLRPAAGHAVIQTTSGRVEGLEVSSSWGRVSLFHGIPYAEPPRRFEPSSALTVPRRRPIDNVSVNSGGSEPPAPCPQAGHLDGLLEEDCLRLSVFVPADVSYNGDRDRLPIFVFVPGDGFGETGQYDGSAMAAIGRLVVVTVNYRVGVFGFLSTGNSSLTGNAGLTDILSALAWIRANGESFGGNVSSITVGGRFSGSMALSALLTSARFLEGREPLAHRLILHGGMATGPWAVQPRPVLPFTQLAGLADCLPRASIQDTIRCLQEVPARVLLKKAERVPELWRPVIDNVTLHGDPLHLIEFGRFPLSVDVMIGDNSGSGSLCFRKRNKLSAKIESDLLNEEDLGLLIESSLSEFYKVEDEGLAAVVTHEYLYSGYKEKSLRDTYQHFCGTLFIRNPLELAVRYISRFRKNVYRYEFAHHPQSSASPAWLEAAIGDETDFLFPPNGTAFEGEDLQVFQDFLGTWINFIRKGDPASKTGAWPEFDEETKEMFVFTWDGMKLDSSRFLDRDVHFWRQTFTPLLGSVERGLRCRAGSIEGLCESLGHSKSGSGPATTYFLIFLIFLGICVLIGLGAFVYTTWRKHKLLFENHRRTPMLM